MIISKNKKLIILENIQIKGILLNIIIFLENKVINFLSLKEKNHHNSSFCFIY